MWSYQAVATVLSNHTVVYPLLFCNLVFVDETCESNEFAKFSTVFLLVKKLTVFTECMESVLNKLIGAEREKSRWDYVTDIPVQTLQTEIDNTKVRVWRFSKDLPFFSIS